jgi:hypothetical protein
MERNDVKVLLNNHAKALALCKEAFILPFRDRA